MPLYKGLGNWQCGITKPAQTELNLSSYVLNIFQFCESIQKALQAVLVVMATFSECYDEPSQVMQLASSLLNSGKYVIDQELRARQVCRL